MSSSSLSRDRVGLGWRPELTAGIFAYRDRIDIVEVVAEDYFGVPVSELSALRTLSAQVPVTLHGVTAGLASVLPVEQARLDGMACVVDHCQPEFWSEHLAFVRRATLKSAIWLHPCATGKRSKELCAISPAPPRRSAPCRRSKTSLR